MSKSTAHTPPAEQVLRREARLAAAATSVATYPGAIARAAFSRPASTPAGALKLRSGVPQVPSPGDG